MLSFIFRLFKNIILHSLAHIHFYNILSLTGGIGSQTPIFTACESQERGVFAETGSIDRQLRFITLLITRLCVLVPNDVGSVTSSRSKSVVLLVEGNVVNCVHISVSLTSIFYAMALEAEVFAVESSNILKVNIYDTTSAFNASNCVSLSISKT